MPIKVNNDSRLSSNRARLYLVCLRLEACQMLGRLTGKSNSMLTAYPQFYFRLEFPDILSQILHAIIDGVCLGILI